MKLTDWLTSQVLVIDSTPVCDSRDAGREKGLDVDPLDIDAHRLVKREGASLRDIGMVNALSSLDTRCY